MALLRDCSRFAFSRSKSWNSMVKCWTYPQSGVSSKYDYFCGKERGYMSTYYVNKSTNTSADTLLAVGFASFLGDIYRELFGTSEDIFISDMGSYYIIVLPHPLGDVDTVNLSQLTLVL